MYTRYLHANLKCSVDLLPLLLFPPPSLLTFPLQLSLSLCPSAITCSLLSQSIAQRAPEKFLV